MSNSLSLFFPIAALLSSPLLLAAQDAAAGPTKVDAKQLYAKLCAGCHGPDAHGTQQGPGLIGNISVRRRPLPRLKATIRNGIPAAGMPPFDLPEDSLNALAALVVSLNSVAAQASVPGDRAAGREFFVGKGQCGSCHMVNGAGKPLGPDLSDVANRLTVEELRESLLQPDAQITPGYGLVTAHLQNGTTLRGFARGRTNFSVELQELSGGLHPLSMDQISKLTDEKKSLMPPLKASPDEVRNLVAYLSRLTGVKPGEFATPQPTGKENIDFSRILNPKPGDWITYNGKISGNRYSELNQINAGNVSKLSVKWTYSIPLWTQFLPDTPYFHNNMRYFGLETVPIVADGIMYVTGPNQVFALDARTGHEIWHYAHRRTPGLVSDASLGTNRGVAMLADKVFMVTDNAHLIALNRITGRLVWDVVLPDEPMHYGGTVAPLIVKDMVVTGVSGGDWGIRGFVAAYKADSGERVWRHWSIPSKKGDPGFETWIGTALPSGGGGTWLTGSYDPGTDTLYWATGNPYPDSDDSQRGGDNLFTNCILAMNPATGDVKWYYQFTPHDVHDWDATVPNVLIDTKYRGQDRKLMLDANRNGFFYVFDRTTGELLLSKKFIRKLTWASGIGSDGKPIRTPETDETCPVDAANWNGTAYSPATRLYYVMALEECAVKLTPGSWKSEHPKVEPGKKYLRAINIDTGDIAWERPEIGPIDGKRDAGVMATAGGLVFYGDPSGEFVAVDEQNGKTLWHLPLNATVKTSPITYAVDGEQYVALAAGSNIMCFGLPH